MIAAKLATGDTDQNSPKTADKTVNLSLFTITKTSTSTPTTAGDVISYTITMTNTELTDGKYPELKKLAASMAVAQQNEIDQMKGFLIALG